MEVRKGYKQTEVGVIPEGWDIKPCSSISDFITVGIVIRPTQYYVQQGVPALRSANVREEGINEVDMVFISEKANKLLAKSQLREADVVSVRTGYPGTSAVVPANLAGSNCIDLLITRPSKAVNSKYLVYWINSPHGKDQVIRTQGGLAQQHFNVGELRNLMVALPTLAEQEAIAEALSDADALIESLETLLAKKRQVKQGAISELLTGKKRLSGFENKSGYKQTEVGIIPEDWDAVSILEICDDKKGSIKIGPFGSQLKREYLVSSGYKVYGQENVYAQDVEIGDRYLTKEHFLRLKSCELLSGDFIVSMMGTIGQCMIVPDGIQQGIIDSHLIRIRLNPKVVVPTYMSYYYSSKLVFDQISRLQVGGIMAGLSSSVIKQIYIGLPNSTKEQTAIAEILSDMDAEIHAVEEKLSKARGVKAGMMSALLTGRVRLV